MAHSSINGSAVTAGSWKLTLSSPGSDGSVFTDSLLEVTGQNILVTNENEHGFLTYS